MTPATQFRPKYDPTEHYSELTQDSAQPERILRTLIGRSSPHLSPEVVRDQGHRIEEILSVRKYLRDRFKAVLAEFGINGGVENIERLQTSDLIPEIEELCALAKDRATREQLRERLDYERNILVADILERLGFLPEEIFSRKKHANGDRKKQFDLLHETFPPWFPPPNGGSALERIDLASLSRAKLKQVAKLVARADWMREAREEFQRCVLEAFTQISHLRNLLVPEGEIKQPYELSSDLGTKSLVELLEIAINPNLPPRRRIDAFLVLRWTIALFAVHSEPVYRERINVQNAVHQILNMDVWAEYVEYKPLPVTVTGENEDGEPLFDLAKRGDHQRGRVIARKLKEPETQPTEDESQELIPVTGGVRAILEEFKDVVARPDVLMFNSRAKSDMSMVIKLLLKQELVRQDLATVDGYDVPNGLSVEDARARLRENAKTVADSNDGLSLEKRPTSFDAILDVVGITFAVILRKKLDEFDTHERERVNDCFHKLAFYLGDLFNLQDINFKNRLWNDDGGLNPKRSKEFREYKVLGRRGIRKIKYVRNKPKCEIVDVPIEVQIQPAKIYLAARSPGSDVSTAGYEGNKAKNVGEIVLPTTVNGISVNPRGNVEGLAHAYN